MLFRLDVVGERKILRNHLRYDTQLQTALSELQTNKKRLLEESHILTTLSSAKDNVTVQPAIHTALLRRAYIRAV